MVHWGNAVPKTKKQKINLITIKFLKTGANPNIKLLADLVQHPL
jgi:hypothetical protein